jgi:hypothetical protein
MSDVDNTAGEKLVVDTVVHEHKAALGAYWTGSRLFVAVSTMVFGAGAFSYFYLHSLDNNGLWRAAGQRPSAFISVPVVALTLVGCLFYLVLTRRVQKDPSNGDDWRVAAVVTLVFLLLAAGIQIWGMRRVHFFPAASGFASVYVAVEPLFAIWLLIGAYWVEVLLARSLRVRWVLSPVGENVGSSEVVAFNGSLDGSRLFIGFLGILSIVLYVLFSVLR